MDSLYYQLEYTGRKRQRSHCECIYTAFRRRLRIDTRQRKRRLRNMPIMAIESTLAEARRYAIEEVEIANVGRRKPQDADTSARQSKSDIAGA